MPTTTSGPEPSMLDHRLAWWLKLFVGHPKHQPVLRDLAGVCFVQLKQFVALHVLVSSFVFALTFLHGERRTIPDSGWWDVCIGVAKLCYCSVATRFHTFCHQVSCHFHYLNYFCCCPNLRQTKLWQAGNRLYVFKTNLGSGFGFVSSKWCSVVPLYT